MLSDRSAGSAEADGLRVLINLFALGVILEEIGSGIKPASFVGLNAPIGARCYLTLAFLSIVGYALGLS